MEKISEIYDKLLENYGRQGWWPVTPLACRENVIEPMYGVATKNPKQRFEIIIGAVLTQNTSWKNVEKAIINLNKENMIDIRRIRAVSTKKLGQLIRPAGYYNQKAERLKLVAKFLYDNHKGNLKALFNRDTLKIRDELLALKGIGPETADSILLYAGDKPTFVIDAYTRRIFSRIGLCSEEADYDELKQLFESSLAKDASVYNEYHALIVEHAKVSCKKNPECDGCCLREICNYNLILSSRAQAEQASLP